jgi:hypothetical protein
MRSNTKQQIAHIRPVGMEGFADLVIGQAFAFSHLPHPLHILPSKSAVPTASLFRHIRRIVRVRPEEQMVGADAPPVITFVANEKAGRNGAEGEDKGKSVGRKIAAADTKSAVSIIVEKLKFPTGRGLMGRRPKPFDFLRGQRYLGKLRCSHFSLLYRLIGQARSGVSALVRAAFILAQNACFS